MNVETYGGRNGMSVWRTYSRTIGRFDRFEITEYFSSEGLPTWFGVTDTCAEYNFIHFDTFDEAMAWVRGDKVNPVDGHLFAL